LPAALALLALTFLVYLPSLGGEFIWGDDLYITGNPLVQSADGLARIWFSKQLPQYYPLTFTTFWLEWRLWGPDPALYRVINILLQGAASVLMWRVLLRLGVPGAWVAAAIFAVHPIQVDSVVWVSERVNVLSGTFFLLAILAYLRFEKQRKEAFFASALGSFLLAVLSKTSVVVLPAVLVLIRVWQRRRWTAGDGLRLAPFFALSAVFAWITIHHEQTQAGAQGEAWEAGLLERVAIAGNIFWFYLLKSFIPWNLMWAYPRWSIDPSSVWACGPGVGAVILFIALVGLGRRARSLLAACVYYLIALFPVLGVFNIYYFRYSYVADHFCYLAVMGVFATVGAIGFWLVTNHVSWSAAGNVWPFRIISGIVVLLLAGLNIARQPTYRNSETLFQATLAQDPGDCFTGVNLGLLHFQRGDVEGAGRAYRTVIEHNPSCDRAYSNLGDVYLTQGRREEAIQVLQEAIRVNPRSTEALHNLGAGHHEAGRLAEAVGYYEQVLTINPYSRRSLKNLALAYASLGQAEKAMEYSERTLAISPGDTVVRRRLADWLERAGRLDEAGKHYREYLRFKPDDPEVQAKLRGMAVSSPEKRTP
jgi:tetratricopeptide (TPR) repeat protein